MISALFLFLSAAILQRTFGSVPVVIWGGGNDIEYPSSSGLNKISTDEFSDIMTKILAEKSPSNVVVFVQESLSSEDFGSKDANENSAYPNLENELSRDIPTKYFPYVDKPLDGLKSLSERGFRISESDAKSMNQSGNSKNLLILKLDENDNVGDRISLLRNHDNLIHNTCSMIKEMDKGAICILTGLRPSWVGPSLLRSSRHLLETTDSAASLPSTAFKVPKFGLFYTKQPPLLENIKDKTQYNVTFVNTVPATGAVDKLSVTADITKLNTTSVETSRIKLLFSFAIQNNSNHWNLDYIYLTIPYSSSVPVATNSTSDISGWFKYSFHTPSTVVFNSSDYKLTFYSMQVELFNDVDRDSFSMALDTVEFFTIPIWSGLFVTSLLITIVLIGLSLIYDIKTMDQFDDPKGKPLTINASD